MMRWLDRLAEGFWKQPPHYPIYVLGSGRSGTSVVRNALVETLGWQSFGEGHLLQLFHALRHATDRHLHATRRLGQQDGHMLGALEPEAFTRGLAQMLRTMNHDAFGTEHFIDKTPGIRALEAYDVIRAAYPRSRIVITKRRGLDVVASMAKKFPEVSFERHCELWVGSMTATHVAANELGEAALVLDQHGILTEPHATAGSLADFLKLGRTHRDKMAAHFANRRPQASQSAKALATPRGLDSMGWTDEQVAIFRRVCGDTMELYGYGLVNSYWGKDGEADLEELPIEPRRFER